MEHLPNKLQQSIESHLIHRTGDLKSPLGDKTVICETHGAYTSTGARYLGNREIWTKCPDCQDALLAAERAEDAAKKAEAMRALIERQIENSCIPKRFVGRTFENFKTASKTQEAALVIAKEYAEKFRVHYAKGAGLIMSGMPGTGKSHLAIAILQSIMPGHCGLYLTCMEIIRSIRGAWRKDSEHSESSVLNTLCTVPLLVIDEIGVQYGTDGEQTILFDVIDRRYREMQPTILLTNQAKQGFKEFIGERSFDRLVETSRWVTFDWPSYRAQARREAA